MRKTTMLFLFISSTFGVYNPYEDASSPEYPKLFREFRSFVIKVLFANLKRKEKVRFKPETTSCIKKCGEIRSNRSYCHCDADCQLFQDCCLDYLKICKPNTTIIKAEQEKWQCISDLYHQHLSYLPWYDESESGTTLNISRIKGYMMISTCLNCSHELKQNCSSPVKLLNHNMEVEKLPVEGPDGNTYKNRFCALGNGVKPESIKPWRFELLCSGPIVAKNVTAKIEAAVNDCIKNQNCFPERNAYKNCTWYYAPPSNVTKISTVCSPVKMCPQTPPINTTASKYTELRLKCQAYMRIVHHNGSFYKNFHCALCYGIGPTDLQNPPSTSSYAAMLSIFFESPKTWPNRYKEDTNRLKPTKNDINTTNTVKNGSSSTGQDTAEFTLDMYFNYIGLSVSMVTLLLLLALYSLVKALRTTPGKIIIGLSTSILAYQILLFLAVKFSEKAVECSVIAVFLHFDILSCFAWMSVMSFDVWKTFGKNDMKPIRKKSSPFFYYLLYVFINPVVIVLTSVALDRSGVMVVYWREGASRACWIVNNLPLILFFKVPVGISLAFNVIAFIWTIVGITNVRNKTMKYNSTRSKHTINKNIKMYGKLSVVMGFTWILGFCLDYSVVIKFIYLIVNSLQGFFIFLAFVTNKRVVEKCKMSRPSWSQSQGSWLSTRKISSGSNMI